MTVGFGLASEPRRTSPGGGDAMNMSRTTAMLVSVVVSGAALAEEMGAAKVPTRETYPAALVERPLTPTRNLDIGVAVQPGDLGVLSASLRSDHACPAHVDGPLEGTRRRRPGLAPRSSSPRRRRQRRGSGPRRVICSGKVA